MNFFGVTTREILDNIAGNTKLRKMVRSLSPSADPSTHSGLQLIDLAYGLEEYLFDIYDTRKHPTTLLKPRDAFDFSLLTHGAGLHRIRKLNDVLPILMPTAKGRPRTIDPSRGVWVILCGAYDFFDLKPLKTVAMTTNCFSGIK